MMRHPTPRFGAYLLVAIAAGLAICASTIAVGQYWVIRSARPFMYVGIDEVPARELALVPGVGSARPGRPSRTLAERLRVALALYRAHKVGGILISGVGDGSARDEMVEMRRWLDVRGVPPQHIVSDPGGYRTFDTMWRAANLLHVSGVIICTQVANVTRSIFLARGAGIDAVGVLTPFAQPPSVFGWRQDAFKTILAIVDTYVLHRLPHDSSSHGVFDGRWLVATAGD
jgi:vancomycin permeability regulator SanA